MKRKLKSLHISLLPLSVLLFFFATAATSAGEVDERIKALEEVQRANAEELNRLKGEQMELKKEATAATAALPNFTYRPGNGLSIQAADRSWEIRFRMDTNGHISFFPQNRSKDDSIATSEGTAGGASQGTIRMRRIRPAIDWYWGDGLYHASILEQWDAATPQALNFWYDLNFSKWSPYYPTFSFGRKGTLFNPVGANYNGLTDTTLERPLFENDLLGTTSAMKLALAWNDVPLLFLPGTIDEFSLNYYPGGMDLKDVSSIPNADHKGFIVALMLAPFNKSKNKWLEGTHLGLGYLTDTQNRDVDGEDITKGSRTFRIRTLIDTNRVTLFRPETRGRREVVTPHVQWRGGPYRFGVAWDFARAERDLSGLGKRKFGAATIDTFIVRNGLWIWGPKGFLTGNESAGGVLAGYTFNRANADAGSGFATNNSFPSFRHQQVDVNTFMLRYLPVSNVVFSWEYDIYNICNMAGTGTSPTAARRRLGIGTGGGNFQMMSFDMHYRF